MQRLFVLVAALAQTAVALPKPDSPANMLKKIDDCYTRLRAVLPKSDLSVEFGGLYQEVPEDFFMAPDPRQPETFVFLADGKLYRVPFQAPEPDPKRAVRSKPREIKGSTGMKVKLPGTVSYPRDNWMLQLKDKETIVVGYGWEEILPGEVTRNGKVYREDAPADALRKKMFVNSADFASMSSVATAKSPPPVKDALEMKTLIEQVLVPDLKRRIGLTVTYFASQPASEAAQPYRAALTNCSLIAPLRRDADDQSRALDEYIRSAPGRQGSGTGDDFWGH